MKIAIVATHSFPIPWKTHTGDVVIVDLATALVWQGHEVSVCAPAGTALPAGCRLLEMPCSWGGYPPTSSDCEMACWHRWNEELRRQDVVHDFSITKQIAWSLIREGRRNVIGIPMGGQWSNLESPMNVVVWSEAMRQRGLRGASDYEGTRFDEWKSDAQPKIKDAKVVFGGVDCTLYDDLVKGRDKGNFLLWMNRWHPAKGYKEAIDLARLTGVEMVLAGEHPDNETYDFQRNCALEAVALSKDLPNVHVEFLPGDPGHHVVKRHLYRRARALVYSVQFHEPFGLSQVEAMASYTPVVGTNLGSVPEIVADGVTGFVRPNDVSMLAEAVAKVGEISLDACRERAVTLFSREAMAARYLVLYRDVIEGRIWG